MILPYRIDEDAQASSEDEDLQQKKSRLRASIGSSGKARHYDSPAADGDGEFLKSDRLESCSNFNGFTKTPSWSVPLSKAQVWIPMPSW